MTPVLALTLILLSFVALIVWIVIYFALVERLLKSLVGAIFGVNIGGFVDELRRRRYAGQSTGFLRGWHITSAPGSIASGCLSDTVIWIIGGLFRLMFIGGAIMAVLALDLYLFFAAFTEPKP